VVSCILVSWLLLSVAVCSGLGSVFGFSIFIPLAVYYNAILGNILFG